MLFTIYANVFSCQVSFHATPDSKKKKMSGIYWVEKLGVPFQTQITTTASSAEKPVHLSLSFPHPQSPQGNVLAFPSQLGDIIPPSCPRSVSGHPARWACPKRLPGIVSGRHPCQMPYSLSIFSKISKKKKKIGMLLSPVTLTPSTPLCV